MENILLKSQKLSLDEFLPSSLLEQANKILEDSKKPNPNGVDEEPETHEGKERKDATSPEEAKKTQQAQKKQPSKPGKKSKADTEPKDAKEPKAAKGAPTRNAGQGARKRAKRPKAGNGVEESRPTKRRAPATAAGPRDGDHNEDEDADLDDANDDGLYSCQSEKSDDDLAQGLEAEMDMADDAMSPGHVGAQGAGSSTASASQTPPSGHKPDRRLRGKARLAVGGM